MGTTVVYVVMSGDSTHAPDSVFSQQADAESYATRENNLARQRHPHPARAWRVFPIEVDASAGT